MLVLVLVLVLVWVLVLVVVVVVGGGRGNRWTSQMCTLSGKQPHATLIIVKIVS